jgi:RNA polymerase sigma factor (sigma-70 family)
MYEELALANGPTNDRQDVEGLDLRASVSPVSGSGPAFATHDLRTRPEVGRVTAAAYERHAAEIHGFVLRIVRDPDVAADLVADTFTKLFTEEQAHRTPLLPRPWLYRVAANLATSRGRRMQSAIRASSKLQREARADHAPSAEHELMGRERDAALHRALGQVSLEERTALLLAAAGHDGATVASLIGKSHVATRTLMCRARKRLRAALREQDL